MKKGFTLIELLAVIVILAVIALIATPMILNVIETAREGAAISSANGYLEALENYQVMSEFKNEEKFTGTVQVSEINSKISVKGDMPKSGTVTITDNKIVDYNLHFSDYTVTYDETTNKAVAIKGEVEYAVGTEVTIDGVLYHVIKTSYKDDETVTLLRYESIGDMKFDENGGTDFETSTLKTYLNTTYKDTFGDKKSMIVGDITLLDFGTLIEETNENGAKIVKDISGEEGTYAYLYKNGYEDVLNGSESYYSAWTKTKYMNSIIKNSSYDMCYYDETSVKVDAYVIYYAYNNKVGSYNTCGNCNRGCSASSFEGYATRPVITIKKEALN